MTAILAETPKVGQVVDLRGRAWLVENISQGSHGLKYIELACLADDAQSEQLSVLWHAEIAPRVLDDDAWAKICEDGAGDPQVFRSFLKTLAWRSSTAADRDLFQAPFRAGIRLDPYQLLPLRKALKLPRVNLLIADDVGLGKTVEAGLIVRELLLRRRIDYIVVAAPPSMTLQWADEIETKFGLTFQVMDRERLAEIRRLRGYAQNPWTTGARFIVSHRLLTDETYAEGLKEALGEFRGRGLFILDEAHHAAPSSDGSYGIDSQFTRAIRDIAGRFEHRLFLTATPHNGHPNSFSSLLAILDPQRFTRGVEVRPRDLEPVMVRRLKEDLRQLGEAFPERRVEAIEIEAPENSSEIQLSHMLAAYNELRRGRVDKLPPGKRAQARLAFVGLQQRLLSSAAAFAKTLKVHRRSLAAALEAEASSVEVDADAFVSGETEFDLLSNTDEAGNVASLARDDEAYTEAATLAGVAGATKDALRVELAAVDEMLPVAEAAARRRDLRVDHLGAWIRANMLEGRRWNSRRLILFTEYEDTRRWLEARLKELIDDTDQAEDRIAVFSGATSAQRREEVKAAFNADPALEPVRILICTDAAREGINLQTRCYDLVHFDLPWNPARIEQRNGRIDRKLQPNPQVFCRYFHYVNREEDIVLQALVRKTETIRLQLGSAGQVIRDRIAQRLTSEGIGKGKAASLATSIREGDEVEAKFAAQSRRDLDEDQRMERLKRDLDDLRATLERSRERAEVKPLELKAAIEAALSKEHIDMDAISAGRSGSADTYQFDPNALAFAQDPVWGDVLDDLRTRRRNRGEKVNEWRRNAPVRKIAFEPAILEDGRDDSGVVQVHLEHRLVRRLLARFLSQGFQAGLKRITVLESANAQPRVVLLGRLALYGPGASRLHEEIVPITAVWRESRPAGGLKPQRGRGETVTLDQLEAAFADARMPRQNIVDKLLAGAEADVADLQAALASDCAEIAAGVRKALAETAKREADALEKLLTDQRDRIRKADASFNADQLELPGMGVDERRQRDAERRSWHERLARIEKELIDEPARVRASYEVKAERLEPIGLVYLWPK